ncbi:uridine 5'-monophosphate synthase [Chelonus insularis]|uniref:uridine 5'-monophosphate synthase n=1 Tax=Chelonus insularis TaxID=460826 RepID=UPI00158BB738|nr:uridine 5'-monophosphate synthase [Chelonus insularis]
METELKELAISLFEINAVKFGYFVTKVGLKTPVYIDLRVIIAYPKIFSRLSNTLWKLSDNNQKIDQLCGVPYTALPIASLISVESNIPMVIRRKEAKSYGTKKMIEGEYKKGDNCVIIEDVITSGSSILETVKDLTQEGLNVTEALVIMDREQGGKKNIENAGIKVKSLYTLTKLMNYLFEADKITLETIENVTQYIKECSAPLITLNKESSHDRLKMNYASRSKFTMNQLAANLFELMEKKETNLCLAADMTKTNDIIELAELAGPHIVILKIHVDIIDDFYKEFPCTLKELALKHEFLIMEDRKFGDIGNTVALQYSKGLYKISEWADLVTVHPVSGPGVLDGVREALKSTSKDRGIFLITEMSSKGALTTGNYIKESLSLSAQSDLVVGHVCQSNIFNDLGLIQLTPGVKLETSTDNLGQQYNTPESVVNNGADIVVVGRGITEAPDQLKAILEYKTQLWTAYKKRIA